MGYVPPRPMPDYATRKRHAEWREEKRRIAATAAGDQPLSNYLAKNYQKVTTFDHRDHMKEIKARLQGDGSDNDLQPASPSQIEVTAGVLWDSLRPMPAPVSPAVALWGVRLYIIIGLLLLFGIASTAV